MQIRIVTCPNTRNKLLMLQSFTVSFLALINTQITHRISSWALKMEPTPKKLEHDISKKKNPTEYRN